MNTEKQIGSSHDSAPMICVGFNIGKGNNGETKPANESLTAVKEGGRPSVICFLEPRGTKECNKIVLEKTLKKEGYIVSKTTEAWIAYDQNDWRPANFPNFYDGYSVQSYVEQEIFENTRHNASVERARLKILVLEKVDEKCKHFLVVIAYHGRNTTAKFDVKERKILAIDEAVGRIVERCRMNQVRSSVVVQADTNIKSFFNRDRLQHLRVLEKGKKCRNRQIDFALAYGLSKETTCDEFVPSVDPRFYVEDGHCPVVVTFKWPTETVEESSPSVENLALKMPNYVDIDQVVSKIANSVFTAMFVQTAQDMLVGYLSDKGTTNWEEYVQAKTKGTLKDTFKDILTGYLKGELLGCLPSAAGVLSNKQTPPQVVQPPSATTKSSFSFVHKCTLPSFGEFITKKLIAGTARYSGTGAFNIMSGAPLSIGTKSGVYVQKSLTHIEYSTTNGTLIRIAGSPEVLSSSDYVNNFEAALARNGVMRRSQGHFSPQQQVQIQALSPPHDENADLRAQIEAMEKEAERAELQNKLRFLKEARERRKSDETKNVENKPAVNGHDQDPSAKAQATVQLKPEEVQILACTKHTGLVDWQEGLVREP